MFGSYYQTLFFQSREAEILTYNMKEIEIDIPGN